MGRNGREKRDGEEVHCTSQELGAHDMIRMKRGMERGVVT